jgi:hypothetical protein
MFILIAGWKFETHNIIVILAIITVASLKLKIHCSGASVIGLNNNEYQITRGKVCFMFPLLNFFLFRSLFLMKHQLTWNYISIEKQALNKSVGLGQTCDFVKVQVLLCSTFFLLHAIMKICRVEKRFLILYSPLCCKYSFSGRFHEYTIS